MTSCRRFLVEGLVQGVYYRATTVDEARRLGLTGWVRNCSDGRVELVACGEATKLAELERWLWKGPPAARVENVIVADEPLQRFNGFSVRR
jgi:acylphosphatase